MAGLRSQPQGDPPNDTGGGLHQIATTRTSRWVKVFGIVIVVLVLLFVALHLTGHGAGGHTTLLSAAQQP